MKRVVFIFTLLLCTICLCAQQLTDCVHLKNGSIIKGIIIEQIPGESLKIQTPGGSIFVYRMDEVEKITKEQSQAYQAPVNNYPGNANAYYGNYNPYSTLRMNGYGIIDLNDRVVSSSKLIELLGQDRYNSYMDYHKAENGFLALMVVGEVAGLLSTGAACMSGALVKNRAAWLTPVAGVSTAAFMYGISAGTFYRKKIQGLLDEYNGASGQNKNTPGQRKLTLMLNPGIGFMYADYLGGSPEEDAQYESMGVETYNKSGFSLPLSLGVEYRPWEDKIFMAGAAAGIEFSQSGFGGLYRGEYSSYKLLDATVDMTCLKLEMYVGFQTLGKEHPYVYGKAGLGLASFNSPKITAIVRDEDGITRGSEQKTITGTEGIKLRPFVELGVGGNVRWGVRYSIFSLNGSTNFNAWQLVVDMPIFRIFTY